MGAFILQDFNCTALTAFICVCNEVFELLGLYRVKLESESLTNPIFWTETGTLVINPSALVDQYFYQIPILMFGRTAPKTTVS